MSKPRTRKPRALPQPGPAAGQQRVSPQAMTEATTAALAVFCPDDDDNADDSGEAR